MRLLHPSGGQPAYPPEGAMVEVPRRSSVDSCGRLLSAMRTVLVELIDAERIRTLMPAVFAVGLVSAAFASVAIVAALEVAR